MAPFHIRRTHLFALLLPLIAAPVHLHGQSLDAAKAPIQFEVVSIRPHRSVGDDPSNRQVLPGGRFVATATSVRTLIRIALNADDERISGAPHWIDNELFDITAVTADHADITTTEQFQQLILSLLEERFQFKFHTEKKEGPVYWLELDKPGKLGPALKRSISTGRPGMSMNSNGSMVDMKVSNASMSDVAASLRRQAGRTVEDHTNLEGKFDFQIEWATDKNADSSAPSLFTVLKEQLGLKLQPARGSVETLFIDAIEHPAAN